MIKGSEFVGGPILNSKNELTEYYVKELIYCSRKLKVLGLLVQKHIKCKEQKVVQYKKITSFNQNGIAVSSNNDILAIHQIPEIELALSTTSSIVGFEICGINGDLVGIVKDTIIEVKTGKIIGLIISEGVLTDLVNGYSIIPLSNHIDFEKRNMIVDHNHFQESILYQQGGLKKLFGIEHEN